MDEFDVYASSTPLDNAEVPKTNGTLAFVYGIEQGNFADIAQQTSTLGPAHVAREKAKLARADNLQLMKEATVELAKQGNTPAVTNALNQIKQLEVPTQYTFHDDVAVSSEAEMEKALLRSKVPATEVARRSQQMSNDIALRTMLETNISSLESRSTPVQLIMDLTGATTAESWLRVSPYVNEQLESLGFTGNRALTFAQSAENTRALLRALPAEDAPKIINTLRDKLVSVLGEGGARRFFEAVAQPLSVDATTEVVFGALDTLMLTGLAKGAIRSSLKASRGIAIGKDMRGSDGIALDLANSIEHNTSMLGASKAEAVDGAITARTLLSTELEGVAPSVQQNLRTRLESTLKDLENSMYTGGANLDEIAATKARLERIYSKEANSSIVASKIEANTEIGKVRVDVTYGDSAGNPFDTPEEALNYYKQWKRGELEVVPVNGTTPTASWESRIDSLINEFGYTSRVGESSKATGSAGARVIQIADMDEAAFMAKHGNSKADVKAHEFAHNWWNGGNGLPNPKSPSFKGLFKEARKVSKQFRPYVWQNHSEHASKVEELLADAMAYWIKHPEQHNNLPELTKYFEDAGVAARLKAKGKSNFEVVPVGGTDAEKLRVMEAVDGKLTSLTNQIAESKYIPRLSTVNNLADIKAESPMWVNAKVVRGESSRLIPGAKAVEETQPLVRDVWSSVRSKALPREQLVIDNLINSLPKETKVVVKDGGGRPYYMPASDTIVMYGGNRDTNLFSHEIIHAITSHKIAYGKANPTTSSLGKIVTNMDALRNKVISGINKVTDPELKKDLEYLTKDLEEFSTSGLWSINQLPKVAVYLNNIKYKNTTLLSELWKSFKELLGFGEKDTALAEWFGLTEEMSKQGLRVKLPEQIVAGDNTFVNSSLLRVYPKHGEVVVNPHVDNLFKQFEQAVSDKIDLDPRFSPTPTGYYVRQKVDMPVFVEDIGKISQDELDKIHLNLGKVNPRLASVNSLYSPALTSMFKRTKYGKVYSDFIKQSFDKLNSDSIDKVNHALAATEKLKRDMTVAELGENGLRTADEQEAYYAFRTMRNVQYYYKNKEAVNALASRGYSNVFIGLDELGEFTGPAKQRNLEDFVYKNVYDVENNKITTITLDNIKEFDSRGLAIYEYAKAQQVVGRKGHITVVAVPANKVRVGDLTSVVGRVDGAYSRIYTEEFFVKIKGKQLVNDVQEDMTYAFRTAVSEKDAAAYTKGFNSLLDVRRGLKLITEADVSKALGAFEKEAAKLADDINNGVYDGVRADFNYTRLDDNFFRDVTGIGTDDISGGKVFWSERTEQGIKSISTGSTDLEIQGPLQSLEAEISNTARFTAMNEWRRNAIQRWYNTFEDVISPIDKKGTKTAEDVFFNVVNNAKGYALSSTDAKQMLSTKDFIVNQLAVKTVDEKVISHAINTITNNITPQAFAHVGQVIRKADILGWAKSVNSTLMLGMFAPAQLVVQSSGMLLAATMSPVHGIKAAFSIRPILTALTSDNPTVWAKLHKTMGVSKNTGMDVSEFGRVAAAIKRVGLLDNIGASSIYNGADGSVNIFARKSAKFNQAQMMFFNTGEEINRVGAFEIARREFIAANPNVSWEMQDSLQRIVQRADDLSMNMTQVNEARYAKGVFGIPLQFLQHNIRLGTNLASTLSSIVGKKSPTLSPAEAFQLTLGSYLLYGISNNATPDFIEEWLGEKFNSSLSETEKQYLTQGVLAGLISTVGEALTGERVNIALGSRLSSIQWYEDLGDAIYGLFKGEKADLKKLAGPTGSTLVAALELPVIFNDYISKDEFGLADFGRTMSAMGSTMVSSWRGIDKAYWAYHANGMVMGKRGDPQAVLTRPEMMFQALGFQSTEAYESSTVFKTKKDYATTMQSYADSIMRLEGLARKAYLDNDINSMNANYRAASAVIAPLPMADQVYIKRLIRDTTSYDTVGREAFNKWATQMSSHKNRLLVTNPYGEVNGE